MKSWSSFECTTHTYYPKAKGDINDVPQQLIEVMICYILRRSVDKKPTGARES